MTPKERKRMRHRVDFLRARLMVNQKRLDAVDEADALALPKRIKPLVKRLIAEGKLPAPTDSDKDGDPDFDEFGAALVKYLDEHHEPDNELSEWVSDMGLEIAAFACVTIYENRKHILENRIAHDKRVIAELEKQLQPLKKVG